MDKLRKITKKKMTNSKEIFSNSYDYLGIGAWILKFEI